MDFQFSELFSIRPMIEYTQQGGVRKGMQAIPAAMLPGDAQSVPAMVGEKYLYADFKSETKFDYIMIPVLANFGKTLNDLPVRLYANAGPFVSFLMNAEQITRGSSFLYVDSAGDMTMDYLLGSLAGVPPQGVIPMDNARNITDEVNKINYGISANLGISYKFAEHHDILLEVGGNYGFNKLQKSVENGENRIGAATIVFGYAYRLK